MRDAKKDIMDLAIETKDWGCIYKTRGNKKEEARERVALRNVNLEVKRGGCFDLLGLNGAGKTTLIKILTALLYSSSGETFIVFRICDHRARELGHIDRVTN
jgi:ABC-2 type transport system ATP-binding protein